MDTERSRIVLIGTAAYVDPSLPNVPAVRNNITDLAAVLTDPDLGGFRRAHCVTAPSPSSVAQIGDLLVRAAAEAEDLLLIYYSGHGLLGPLRRELYLSLSGTRPDRMAFTALPFDAVRDACLESRASSRVVILDSCFSGRAIGDTLAGADESVLGQIQVKGTYTLTSAPANRTAVVLPGERNTAFTGRMLQLLRDGIPGAGPMIGLGHIYRNLYREMMAAGLPVPQQCGTETADLLGLVRNRQSTRVQPPGPAESGTPRVQTDPPLTSAAESVAKSARPPAAPQHNAIEETWRPERPRLRWIKPLMKPRPWFWKTKGTLLGLAVLTAPSAPVLHYTHDSKYHSLAAGDAFSYSTVNPALVLLLMLGIVAVLGIRTAMLRDVGLGWRVAGYVCGTICAAYILATTSFLIFFGQSYWIDGLSSDTGSLRLAPGLAAMPALITLVLVLYIRRDLETGRPSTGRQVWRIIRDNLSPGTQR